MERSRKRSVGRPKSPAAKSPSKGERGRSKSRTRQPKKESQKKPRSKSRSAKDKARGRSKSPGRPKATKPSKVSSRIKTQNKSEEFEDDDDDDYVPIVKSDKKLNLVLKDVLDDGYSKDPTINDIIRRSLSRDISQEKVPLRRSSRLVSTKENENIRKSTSSIRESLPKTESFKAVQSRFSGGWPEAVFGILYLPVFVLLFHLSCTSEKCTLSKFHIPRNWRLYLNSTSGGITVGFLIVQALLAILPIGRRVGGPPGRNGTLQYRCNGFLTAILSCAIVAGLWYYKIPVTIINDKIPSLIVSSALLGYFLAIILFIKGGRAPVPGLNPDGINNTRLYQFFAGREVNPILFRRFNVKTILLRTCLNALVLINGLYILKAYESHSLNYTLLTCVGLQTLYIMDFYWFEDSFPSTFEAMYEGTGCNLATGYLLYPFVPTLITKYIVQHKVQLPVYGLVAIAVLYFIGFIIYRASNLQKAAFRRNPLNPALAHFETISTTRGKKLLVAGWWGWVRHPNYLGDIILHWAWASTTGYAHVIPYVFPLFTTLFLIHRAHRDDVKCRQRYQSSWTEYCNRVRYRILPRIY